MADLALEELYAGYVIPGFLDSVNRAEEAEQRADEEAAARRQAEEQLQAARAEIARLRQDRS